ncbi:hypothetical protein S40288_09312 [Stachybotrys chartarum IBT 40288]|nr:hypothetical protein S40288_09312 [Stachybotrys chartarum IBT 40288]
MTVAAHIVGAFGDMHDLSDEQRMSMTPEEAQPYVFATQWFCVGVATYILFIWTLKLNMLFLYQRIVKDLWVERFILPTIGLVVATLIVCFIILFSACRPYHRMWTMWPDQGPNCQPQSRLNMIPPLAMNLVTDACIMAIPVPVVLLVRTTFWKRAGLIFLFSAGIFIMVAAILRVTMVLIEQNGPTAAIWSVREDFIAIVVGQAILLRPMFTKSFWTGRHEVSSAAYSSRPSNQSSSQDTQYGGFRRVFKSKSRDPFSVSLALATVQGERGHESMDNILESQPHEPKNIHDSAAAPQAEAREGFTDNDNRPSGARAGGIK